MKQLILTSYFVLTVGSSVYAQPKAKPEWVSKAPQFTFAETLAEQKKQLNTNSLMMRFAENRKKRADEPHLPNYHFVAPDKASHDPNGLCFWQGRWHLFYQAYPPEHPVQHWGHAFSEDLIHWKDLPYAIYPGPEEKCYSVACYVEEDRVIAAYPGINYGRMIAVADDPLLLNWQKINNEQPVIPWGQKGGGGDCCIWKEGDQYYMLGAGQKRNKADGKLIRANDLFQSTNLVDWKYLHPFVENDIYSRVGDDGACPYFWPIGKDKHILIHFSHCRGSKYLLGNYDKDRQKFTATDGNYLNFGSFAPGGVHAPSAYPDGKGGVVVIHNMNYGYNPKGWKQCMTLPRRITYVDEDKYAPLRFEPPDNIQSLRGKKVSLENIELPAEKEIVLENIQGKSLELEMELSGKTVEINVLRSPDKEETTRILLMKDRGLRRNALPLPPNMTRKPRNSTVTIDNSMSSVLNATPRPPETAEVYLEENENFKLRIFVDKSIVEVFVNSKQVLAVRVYPGREDSKRISLLSREGDAKLISLNAWQMKSINYSLMSTTN